MDFLVSHGINLEVSASEFERSINRRALSTDSISSIRNDLFVEAREAGIVTAGDVLAARRKTNGGKSVKQKHLDDIWQLVCAIKNRTPLRC